MITVCVMEEVGPKGVTDIHIQKAMYICSLRSSHNGVSLCRLSLLPAYVFVIVFLSGWSRLFRLDRIITARRTQVAYEQPDDFEARAFVENKLQDTPATWKTEVWLDATPETLHCELLPPRE